MSGVSIPQSTRFPSETQIFWAAGRQMHVHARIFRGLLPADARRDNLATGAQLSGAGEASLASLFYDAFSCYAESIDPLFALQN